MPRYSTLLTLFVAISAWLGLALPALAHPHVFVTSRTEILYDASGAVKALRHRWSFDEAYSAYMVQGLDKNGDGKISKDEFIGKKTGEAKEEAEKAFAAKDKDKDGSLSKDEFTAAPKKKDK